ncbi:hypothetical protein CNMCM5793_004837 [Aspergillus hiratsukae]|uniref:BZIP domain-containing protein n=1 Tax=Aspergillus hiratsukae TaxID=1194566 RepID=A0A8H6P146_9EURO|nr:hypothetical protein CNMCM5793_004837 [Aspergillus hiratsukae]
MANESSTRRRSLLELPAEIIQHSLGFLDEEELRRIVRDVEDLASHAKEVIKVRFRENNTYTLPDEAAVLERHGGRLPDNVLPTNRLRHPCEVPFVRTGDTIAGIIRTNNLVILKILVEAGLDLMSFSMGGWRLLGLALAWGNIATAKYLIARMKPEDLLYGVCRVGRRGEPPNFLTMAAYFNADIFSVVWQRVRGLPNCQEQVTEVARFQLCRHADALLAWELAEDGVDIALSVMPFVGRTAWHAAAESNTNMDFFEYLYGRIPESINNITAENGRTPLMLAAAETWQDRSNAVRWLLRHWADPRIVAGGRTAAWFASAAHNLQLASLLSSYSSPYSDTTAFCSPNFVFPDTNLDLAASFAPDASLSFCDTDLSALLAPPDLTGFSGLDYTSLPTGTSNSPYAPDSFDLNAIPTPAIDVNDSMPFLDIDSSGTDSDTQINSQVQAPTPPLLMPAARPPPVSITAAPSSSGDNSPKESSNRVYKRQLNTLAARRYRQRRVDRMNQLEEELEKVKRERDELKMRVSKLEGETEALRGLLKNKEK